MEKDNRFPYEIKPYGKEENEELLDYFKGFRIYFNRVGPNGYVLPRKYVKIASNIYNFPLRSDDVFVVSFPKSGTTWVQELVWLILNNLDYEKSNSISLTDRFPFLEVSIFSPDEDVSEEQKNVFMANTLAPITIDGIKELPSPRFIKSHLPLSFLPPTLLDETKVVYVARDPRDVAVSYFYHFKLLRIMAPDRDFKTYWNYFINDRINWCPYFASVLEAWEKRNHPNMLFLFYEELSEDLPGVIRRVAKFFDKQLSDNQVTELREHLKFDNFKQKKSVNFKHMQDKGVFTTDGAFIRKGKVGGWREYFDEDMTAQAEQWINKNLRGTDFKYPQ